MKVLLTGFEPFEGERENPASMVLELIPDVMDDIEVRKLILPVSFRRCITAVGEFLERESVDCVISLGQAGGRADISIERIAVNLMVAKSADCDGFQPHGTAVIERGPAAYITSMPIEEMRRSVTQARIPSHISNSTGLFVCNALYYQLMHRYPHLPACFIHLPYLPCQAVNKPASTPSMTAELMVEAVKRILQTLSRTHLPW